MPTVGEILAAERRRQGKSIHDVVEGTKIRSRLVEALENNDFDVLPPSAYIKGYIQGYARFLEIPSEPLLQQFRREYGEHKKAANPADRFLGMDTAHLRSVPSDTVVPHAEQAHAIPRGVWIGVAAGLILVLLIICGISRSCAAAPKSTPTPQPVTTEPTSAITASPGSETPEPTTTIEPVQTSFKIRVTVRQGQASWVQVTVDGLKAFEGTLTDGESREWLVTEKAVVKAGRPSVVKLQRDGETVTFQAVSGIGVATLEANPTE
jgi:cytoskeleton protein RodZ